MITANVHDAKTNLSKLLAQAAAGEEVYIASRGKRLVKLTPVDEGPMASELFGSMKGEIHFAPDYDDADKEIQEMFDENLNKPLP